MESIAEKLIKLRLATRRACRKKDGADKKSVLSLCDKALFLLLGGPLPPDELTDALLIGKANLTHLAGKMISDGLIEKTRRGNDARCIRYAITQKGKDCIRKTLSSLDGEFRTVLTKESDYAAALDNMDEVIRILSFLE